MHQLSDSLLSSLNIIFQWVAIIGILIGLLSSTALIYIRKEIGSRNEVILKEAHSKISELENITKPLQTTVEKQDKLLDTSIKHVEQYRQKLNAIQEKATPRTISAEKKILIQNELSKHKGSTINIYAIKGDSESVAFAVQFQNIFEASGWTVAGIHESLSPFNGIHMSIKSDDMIQKANLVYEALTLSGFDIIKTRVDSDYNGIILIVGSKK